MKNIIEDVRKALKEASDEKTLSSGKRFFKEEVRFYGVTMPKTQKIAKDKFVSIKGLNKKEIFGFCEELLKSGYIEEAMVAAHWAYFINKQYQSSDIDVFERWIEKYIDNWAECDTLCNHAVGTLVEMYPEHIERLKKWTKSSNRWMKRAAAVSLIIPARKGKFLNEIMQIANSLLEDKDDLVQKGYGWMLKAASQAHEKKIYDFVMKNKRKMPRTALRYAIEKMSPNLRKSAMEK
ncbi:DNA alkylation repair protein [Candidatus Gottesmanbacteria bacterium RIFCSPHIGHO2_01_FULL_39_10]|uniref:DNA alkylation repair protein n=1 Tax=Candidatus Gottesmanbacteria bacterium RIFCSPHIGHO2_01_FULL_39_10 TaxID=1798375 RepID=A0A1F5ZQ99_9BACT|nr:MAG: DNA alkylation repair protein [Candidatus Gottesmanbacteria bacterium RIFCSPHIGHO2_01_FULL_39_10]